MFSFAFVAEIVNDSRFGRIAFKKQLIFRQMTKRKEEKKLFEHVACYKHTITTQHEWKIYFFSLFLLLHLLMLNRSSPCIGLGLYFLLFLFFYFSFTLSGDKTFNFLFRSNENILRKIYIYCAFARFWIFWNEILFQRMCVDAGLNTIYWCMFHKKDKKKPTSKPNHINAMHTNTMCTHNAGIQ